MSIDALDTSVQEKLVEMTVDSSNGYRMCTKTVMDTTDPDITFDDHGICNHWYEYKELEDQYVKKGKQGEIEFQSVIDNIKKNGKGKEYDCIMGVSGGVDSSYVAYIAKLNGLRPLAVHFDNGWNDELAVKNIENMLNILGIDLHTLVVDWDEFRSLQLSFIRSGVVNIEVPTDHAIVATLYKIASKKGIKHILSGNNVVTEAIMPKAWGYDNKDLRHIKGVHRAFCNTPLSTYPTISFPAYVYYTFGKKIRNIKILDYIAYNKKRAKETLQRELRWRDYGGKHYESIFTRFYQAYILPNKFNIDKRKAHLSTLICSGQISREEALQELSRPICDSDKIINDMEFFLKKLDLSPDEFNNIMMSPPKSENDYPSNKMLFDFIRKIRDR